MDRTIIPDEAKKVFSGVLFDVFQWQQKMFDGSFATFERLKRADSTCVLAVVGGKIAVSFEEQPASEPFTGFPCGLLDDGEVPLDGAKRELLEETGLVSDDWELYGSWPVGNKISWDEHIFIARNCKKVANTKFDNGERIRTEFISFDELVSFTVRDDFRLKNFTLHLLLLKEKGELESLKKKLFP